ncbi:DNA polymerase III subunit epsilon [Bosea sp. RAC05]|uniref:DNA polymerase III subunit epsilon n=1 Tax=Bosea sp. RAC05 TaxID=1842539 RepID=UPI00083E1BFB|nr:DNA polymerase III subunit epsilon [Bosea sp. RAC05]AOG03459.1 DNA polymerase III, epsilon subunit [Bosea sp. RAC05]
MTDRLIFFDTETTGFTPPADRVVEFGGVEVIDTVETGNVLHKYINPQRDMPEDAFKVHGLSEEFLRDKPVFAAVAREIADFLDGATVVAHNAGFDIKFLTAEFAKVGIKPPWKTYVDTLIIAKRRFPSSPNSLDALLDRFGIDRSNRTLHGALLDAKLLIPVYIKLLNLDQLRLTRDEAPAEVVASVIPNQARQTWFPRRDAIAASATEAARHQAFLAKLGDSALWKQWAEEAQEAAAA